MTLRTSFSYNECLHPWKALCPVLHSTTPRPGSFQIFQGGKNIGEAVTLMMPQEDVCEIFLMFREYALQCDDEGRENKNMLSW
jgi:hypothetical protein